MRGRRRAGVAVLAVMCSTGLLTGACAAGNADPGAQAPTVGGSAPAGSASPHGDRVPAGGGSLAGKVIVIDPGHNGGNASHPETRKLVDVITKRKPCDSTGTESKDGYAEHAFNWDVSQRLAKRLRERGAKVVLTRTGDDGAGPCITERAKIGNDEKADAAVSVHADGAGSGDHGFHIILPGVIRGHTEKMAPVSRKLGLALRESYKKGTGMPYSTYRGKDGIDVRDDLGGLNLSTRPKVFIECGNMKHSGDAAKLSSGEFRQRIADSLADGFANFLT